MVYLTTLALKDKVKKTPPAEENIYCKAYPNPAVKTLYIQSKQGAHKPLLVQLYDITGKPVLERRTQEDNFALDIHYLSEGIYIFRLSNGYGVTLLLDKILIRR
jgi:hypothetical protein